MAPPCVECGGATVWDDDAASEICTTCGTLVDASQSILTTGLEYRADSTSTSWNIQAANQNSTLKSLRNPNWQLSGQGKEARDRQNAAAMNQYITSLASALSVPGLSLRASALFSQAMTIGHLQWGRKANLVAGACLAIALRESKRPDFRHDIASLLNQKPTQLTRVLAVVLSLLNMSLAPNDPSFYLPSLQVYLTTALGGSGDSQPAHTLPNSLITLLKPLSMNSVLSTAHALSDLLARSPSPGSNSAIKASAVAIFILSLEGQARTSFQGLGELAAFLAARFQVGKGTVMKRYKAIEDELVAMMGKIPWLDQYEKKANGRAKVAKRRLISRSLPDILTWGTNSWKAKLQDLEEPKLILDDEQEVDGQSGSVPYTTPRPLAPLSPRHTASRPPKQQNLRHTLSEASQFLLNPLSASIPSLTSRTFKCPSSESTHSMPLTSYLLMAPTDAIQQAKKPTRLQMLSASKLGSDLDDEELFDEGELEGFMRCESEVQIVRQVWEHENPILEKPFVEPKIKRKRKAPDEPKAPSKRVNREALERFMKDVDEDDAGTAFTGLAVAFDENEKSDEEDADGETEFSKIRRAMEHGLLQSSSFVASRDDESVSGTTPVEEWY